MRIGRNDRCPCGSGKKYKKCCLRKGFLNIAPNSSGALGAQPTDFPYITSNALSLNKIVRKYVFEDVIIAAFCLNLWRRNRSALEQSLTLNLSITMGGSFGHNSIKSFDELCSFYDDISGILTVSGHEDYIIDDYGEVFISHEGKSYPVIIGTGYQQVYGALRYLQALSKVCNRQDELTDLLEYSSGILAFTRTVNTPNTNSEIVYELPTPEFWSCITSLFDSPVFAERVEFASKIVGHQEGPIEMRHFVERDGRFFPLFNTSILLDYYKILLNTATDEEKKSHITIAIHSLLENAFNISPNTPNRVLIQPIAVNGETNARIDSKALIFAGFAEDALIIGIPFFIKIDDNGRRSVSAPLLARYVREHLKYILVRDNGTQAALKYVYENGVYKLYDLNMLYGAIKQFITNYDEELVKMSIVKETAQLILSDLNYLSQDELNADEEIINFQNGLLYITGNSTSLMPHSPDVLSTIQLPCRWNENDIPTPVFDEYLDTLSNGDIGVKQLLLEFMGVAISNVQGWRTKKSLFLVGDGNTGKSQLKSLTERLLGKGNFIGIDLSEIEARFGTGAIYGKRLAGSSDMSFMSVSELKTYKRITGGDSVFMEFKGQQPLPRLAFSPDNLRGMHLNSFVRTSF